MNDSQEEERHRESCRQFLDESNSLVRVVRSLDATGPGANGEILRTIKGLLETSTRSEYHVAEQICLRWLLKRMNTSGSPSSEAESIQRSPLTWKILAKLFERIPLVSLAKALADRKFLPVLRRTLNVICQPHIDIEDVVMGISSETKQEFAPEFDLDALRHPSGALSTANGMCGALSVLFDRIKSPMGPCHERFGLEHIKSLFCLSATEAVQMLGPLMTLCERFLIEKDYRVDPEHMTMWIEVMSTLWSLHLQGTGDAAEVAAHLSEPACLLLYALDESRSRHVPLYPRSYWKTGVLAFMRRVLARPARAEFDVYGTTQTLALALQTTASKADISGPILYALCVDEKGKSSPKSADWNKELFRLVEQHLRGADIRDGCSAMRKVLATAQASEASIDTFNLQMATKRYALQPTCTDWGLLGVFTTLEPTMFFVNETGAGILETIYERLHRLEVWDPASGDAEGIASVVNAVVGGYCTSRNLGGFLRRWYSELSKLELRSTEVEDLRRDVGPGAVWLRRYFGALSVPRIGSLIEEHLSPKQVTDFLDHLEGQGSVNVTALYVVLDQMFDGLRSLPFLEAVGVRPYQMVLPHLRNTSLHPEILRLRWSITYSCLKDVRGDALAEMWNEIRPVADQVLRNGPLESSDVLEAFRCCCHFWSISLSDGALRQDVSSVVLQFLDRLAREFEDEMAQQHSFTPYGPIPKLKIRSKNGFLVGDRNSCLNEILFGDTKIIKSLYDGHRSRELPWILNIILEATGCSAKERTKAHYSCANGGECLLAPYRRREVLDVLLSYTKDSPAISKSLISLGETLFMGSLPHPPLPLAIGARRVAPVSFNNCGEALRFLSRIPDEAFSREDRERLAQMLVQQHGSWSQSGMRVSAWQVVLDLEVKLMSRPTYYAGMKIEHLDDLAGGISKCASDAAAVAPAWGTDSFADVTKRLGDALFELCSLTFRYAVSSDGHISKEYVAGAMAYIERLASEPQASAPESHQRLRLAQALKQELSLSESLSVGLDTWISTAVSSYLDVYAASLEQKQQSKATVGDEEPFPVEGPLLAALSVFDKLRVRDLRGGLPLRVEYFNGIADALMETPRSFVGWKLKYFLLTNYPSEMNELLMLEDGNLGLFGKGAVFDRPGSEQGARECVAALFATLSIEKRYGYLERQIKEELSQRRWDGSSATRLAAIQSAIGLLADSDERPAGDDAFDLASAHSLAVSLVPGYCAHENPSVLPILEMLLDKRPGAMTQWNIESSLGFVVDLCSVAEPGESEQLSLEDCVPMMETIIKKHRIRLEGHFHLLVAALAALLRFFLTAQASWHQSADTARFLGSFSRLLTLVCEPTANAVTRPHQRHRHHGQGHGQGHGPLHSATDAAKKSAGRYMYLVLMEYVDLQLKSLVTRPMRDALEPGMFSIFDITGKETRRIMNDAMDEGGRVILREVYTRYERFGKWKGV